MKRIIPFIALLFITVSAQAQFFKSRDKKAAKTEYTIGTVPIENRKVVFREKIEVPGHSAAEIMKNARAWYDKRFVKPTVLSAKIQKEEPTTFEAKAEEYIVFTKKLFVLNRARIYYYLTLECNDGSCNFTMSRITYWHDDENPDGGTRYTAEEIITDEKALDENSALKKNTGRFRTKTIDLKNALVNELKNELNK